MLAKVLKTGRVTQGDDVTLLDGGDELLDGRLRVAEEHRRVRLVEEVVVDPCEAGIHAALEDDDVRGLVDVQDRHAVERALRVVARGGVRDVVRADDERDVGARELRG
jgi:hypothetical protein